VKALSSSPSTTKKKKTTKKLKYDSIRKMSTTHENIKEKYREKIVDTVDMTRQTVLLLPKQYISYEM
jgi:hypothetical protein